jgi:16S rRNA (guanine527-N7)-methyltransferase
MELVEHYFPELTAEQRRLFDRLQPLYAEWNAQINVISRQDIENLEERHVLHSLAVARVLSFQAGARLLDLGTGGGFPGLPLAILFPESEFHLVDGTGKKIKVVQEVSQALGLANVKAQHARVEDLRPQAGYDFVLSRAVAPLDKLLQWSQRLIAKKHRHTYPNGILALKGGDITAEIRALPGKGSSYTEIFPIREFFDRPFFEGKAVVYMQG